MATMDQAESVVQIGETAGAIWRHLDQHGPQKLTRLVKEIEAPRDLVMQALGWLAREDKIVIEEEGARSKVVSLKTPG